MGGSRLHNGFRWLFDGRRGPRGQMVPRWIFLRALALIYFSAFYSLLFQIKGLIGPDGILPAQDYLADIAQQLGLSADQRKQLAAVAGEHRSETEKLAGEIKKLSPDQRKRPEFQQKALRMLDAVRRRTEAVLTPQQLAALKEMVLRRRAFSTLADPNVEVRIGVDDPQKAAVKGINEEPASRQDRILREAERKLFGVLTPQQRDKIREILDRQGW